MPTIRIPPPDKWEPLSIALPVGQIEDRAISLPDGSRLHWQRFPDGSTKVHKDEYDPKASPLHAVLHVANETPYGTIVKTIGFILLVSSFLQRED